MSYDLPGKRKKVRLLDKKWDYLLALILVLVAQVGTAWLLPFTKSMVFLLFCTAIAVSGILGGIGPGIFATVLAALCSAYWFLPPSNSLRVDHIGALKLSLLVSTGTLISALCGRLHSARYDAEAKWQEIEEMQRRQELLGQLSAMLTAATPFDLGLQNVALLLTRQFADLCLIDVIQPDHMLHRVAVSCSNLLQQDLLQQIALRYPLEMSLAYGPAEVARTGRSEVVRRLNPDIPHHQIMESLGFHSYFSIPLYAPGRRLGVVTLAFAEADHDLKPEELSLATEFARHIAIRVANESLLWAAQEEIDELRQQLSARERQEKVR